MSLFLLGLTCGVLLARLLVRRVGLAVARRGMWPPSFRERASIEVFPLSTRPRNDGRVLYVRRSRKGPEFGGWRWPANARGTE